MKVAIERSHWSLYLRVLAIVGKNEQRSYWSLLGFILNTENMISQGFVELKSHEVTRTPSTGSLGKNILGEYRLFDMARCCKCRHVTLDKSRYNRNI